MPQAWRDGLNADYGMGVFIAPSDLGPRIWHSGDMDGFSSWMAHWPDAGVTAVVLVNVDFHSIDGQAIEALIARDLECAASE